MEDNDSCGFRNCDGIVIACFIDIYGSKFPVCHKHTYSTKEEREEEKFLLLQKIEEKK